MKKILKKIFLLLMIQISVVSLWASGSSEKIDRPLPEDAVKIALLNGPSGIGLIQLKAGEPFADNSVAADVQVMGAPKVLLGQMLKEEWDAAVLPANMAAVLYNKGVGYKTAAVTGLGNLYMIGRTSSAPTSMEELTEKTIYIPGKNTTPDLVTQLIAGQKNLTLNLDYSFNPSDLAKALVGGIADLAVLPEPLATIALKQGKDLEVLYDMQELWKDSFAVDQEYPMTVLVVKNSFADSWPSLTEDLIQAAEASLDWVKSNPVEASALIKEQGFTLPPPIVKLAIPRSNFIFASSSEAEALLTPYFEKIHGLNPPSIGGKVPGDSFYY